MKILSKALSPILHLEVGIKSSEKGTVLLRKSSQVAADTFLFLQNLVSLKLESVFQVFSFGVFHISHLVNHGVFTGIVVSITCHLVTFSSQLVFSFCLHLLSIIISIHFSIFTLQPFQLSCKLGFISISNNLGLKSYTNVNSI